MNTYTQNIQTIARYIEESRQILIFTGAGISTESGISDYRSKGGLWDRFQPVTSQEFMSSPQKRKEYWQTKMELYKSFQTAGPNAGHRAIVTIEKQGKLRGIVTQNIDGLHQMAGSSPDKILELHGSNRKTVCLSCGDLRPWPEVYQRLKAGEGVPLCHFCGGFLKPNTISFGQALDPAILNEAFAWSNSCDLILAVGSTLIVEPAASIPRTAKANGAKLVIITFSDTPLDGIADLKMNCSAGEVLSHALENFSAGSAK